MKKKKFLLNATRLQNRIRYLLHDKFSLGEASNRLNKRLAAEEYAYCFVSYQYQIEGINKKFEELESIKEKDDYPILVNTGTARITEWNRKNGKFPNEDITFLCYFFECLRFNLFFEDIDDCSQYEKKVLIESLDVLEKNYSLNTASENDDKKRCYDLALSTIKFYLVFNPKGYSNNISSLINNVKKFLRSHVFPYTKSLYNFSLHDFISQNFILKIPTQYLVSEFTGLLKDSKYRKVVESNNLKKLMNQLYKLSPKLCYEHFEMNEPYYIADYHQIGKPDLHYKDYNDLNNFLQLNISRFKAYNNISGEDGEKLLLQLEKTAIENWKKLFDGVELALKVHSFQNVKSVLNNQEDYFLEKCNNLLKENALVNAANDLSLETLKDAVHDYKSAKHAYDVSGININEIKKKIHEGKNLINDNFDTNKILSRLIYEYYQYNNSLE